MKNLNIPKIVSLVFILSLGSLTFAQGLDGDDQDTGLDNFRPECSLTSTTDRDSNQIHDYKSVLNPVGKTVLILPPTGGENLADRNLAKTLCRRGYNVVIFNYVQTPDTSLDLSIHDANTVGVLGALDLFLAHRPENNFVIVGSSLGSLYAAMALSLGQNPASASTSTMPEVKTWTHFNKIKAAVLTVCGGSLAEILATSEIPEAVQQRQKRQEIYKITSAQDYLARLRSAIHLDPLDLAQAQQKDKVFMFMSSQDKIVPAKTQMQLWEAFGRPSRSVIALDHMWTIAWVYFFRTDTIFKFVDQI
jgi:pimeloyl-ACP methyl ester carboxylesterase